MVVLRGTVIIDDRTTRDEVRIEGRTLTFAPGGQGEVIEGWILPGLVDAHCHIGLSPEGLGDEQTVREHAYATTATGVLLTRDAGMPIDTRHLDADARAPRIIRAARHVARPRRYIRGLPIDVEDPEDLPRVLAEQALGSDGWVKLVGDWIDRETGDLAPLWTPEQLSAGIAAAHANGARVHVHTFAAASIGPLLDAGVDCIEHGCGMTPEHMQRAAEAGVAVTPTLSQLENFPAIADQAEEKFPIYADHMRRLYDHRFEQVRAMHEAGIQLLIGTDAGGGVRHGTYHNEIDLLRRAGVPDPVIVGAATHHARRYLGVPGISEGAPADVLVYGADPREDATVLRDPIAIFRDGTRL